MIRHWIRFQHLDTVRFGTIEGDKIRIFKGDMFDSPRRTDLAVNLDEVEVLTPCVPARCWRCGTIPRAWPEAGPGAPGRAAYLMKPSTSYLAPGGTIRKPLCEARWRSRASWRS
ncbi:DUF2437 domain-containing protein [Massilia timonae]|uniref:DUF2437 domain-containing protein n=1 Tax=Massilia timonae TaxID=47229 RepID=UPI0027D8CAFF|nr:DUF2437 domain-containing protein [Massilia timonae]